MSKRKQRPPGLVTKIDHRHADPPSFSLLSQAMDLEDVKICVIGSIATAGTLSVSKHVGGRILSDGEIRDLCSCVESLAAAKGHTNLVFASILVAKNCNSSVVWGTLGSVRDLCDESVEIAFASVSVKTCVEPVSHLAESEFMRLWPCSYILNSSSSSGTSSISSIFTEFQ